VCRVQNLDEDTVPLPSWLPSPRVVLLDSKRHVRLEFKKTPDETWGMIVRGMVLIFLASPFLSSRLLKNVPSMSS